MDIKPKATITTESTTYIYSSVSGKQNVALPEVLNSIAETLDQHTDISITHGYLNGKLEKNDGRNQINVEFSKISKNEVLEINKLRANLQDTDSSNPTTSTRIVNQCVIQLPTGPHQDDIKDLLNKTAEFIKTLDDVIIDDIILHNYMADNLIDRPYVRIYYKNI